MSVILCGYHNMGCIALRILTKLGITVPAVFTHLDDPEENRWFNSLGELAKEIGIPVYYPEDINSGPWPDMIRDLRADLLLSCYFRQMIKEDILSSARIAAVNLHGSLLPKYRGRCPVNWQILNGETRGGVTLHHMVKQADAGDIVAQYAVDIDERDTALSLFKKLEYATAQVLEQYIPRLLDGTAPRIPQDHSKATYFGGRRPEDGRIDWSVGANTIYNLIRAVTWPYPGAYSFLRGRRLMIWEAEPVESEGDSDKAPGTVISRGSDRLVQTGKGVLRLLKVSWESCPPVDGIPPHRILKEGEILG